MPATIKSLPNCRWDNWVKRVILHVPHYLSYTGDPTSGGRQRKVRDVARLIQKEIGWECIIVQKGTSDWEAKDKHDNVVIGLKARLDVYGDPGFGKRTRSLLRDGDAIIYMGGEDAWPYFVEGAKAYHVGVWWDGPNNALTKWLTGIRTQKLFSTSRSVICCDTNVINWLRTRNARYQESANRAVYVPNCVDLDQLQVTEREAPSRPLRILFARRFEPKRGPYLMLDAAKLLSENGFSFELVMSSAEGHDGSKIIQTAAKERGIEKKVTTLVNDMTSIFDAYKLADIAVVPTVWSEGTSYSAVEAIAAGLPVVTTTVGGLPNLVVPGFNGFVCPPRAEEIADAIMRYQSDDLWYQHHRNCLSMRDVFSFKTWNHRVLEWLKS